MLVKGVVVAVAVVVVGGVMVMVLVMGVGTVVVVDAPILGVKVGIVDVDDVALLVVDMDNDKGRERG